MELEIITTKKKLTTTILNQLETARVSEMQEVLASPEKILGYINPSASRTNKVRVFLVHTAPQTYKLIQNYNWEKSEHDDLISYGKFAGRVCIKKPFKDKASRDRFVEMFRQIKQIAMQKHIIIGG